jgi:pyruvate/2-oxoglutarate dehydrogenase complex dihydrolipoamide dehydrogenase (E3) component
MRVAQEISLDEQSRQQLERQARGRSVAVRVAVRSRIVLLAADGLQDKQIAEQLNVSTRMAALWRNRFVQAGIAGRRANVEGLKFEAADVAYDKRGVIVDDRLRTSNPRIYAAGDICSHFKFTHAADALARVALRNALFVGRSKASSLVIPWCTFTEPELAHVGLHEHEARKRGHNVVTHTVNLTEVDRAVLDGASEGFARVHTDAKTAAILGATLISDHAGESISELVLAMTRRMAEAKKLGDLSMRARLKPWLHKLLISFFKFRR